MRICILLSLFLLFSCETATNDPSKKYVYFISESFKQRFSIPADKSSSLPIGLQAIGFEFDSSLNNHCVVHLYLDGLTFVQSPGNEDFYESKIQSEYAFYPSYSEEDLKHNIDRLNLADGLLFVQAKNDKVGWVHTPKIDRYYKHFFPNLQLLSFQTVCTVIEEAKNGLNIYIQHRDASDGFKIGRTHPEELDSKAGKNQFYKFEIDNSITTKLLDLVREQNLISERNIEDFKTFFPQ